MYDPLSQPTRDPCFRAPERTRIATRGERQAPMVLGTSEAYGEVEATTVVP